ncbi:MAG: LCP family protein [Pseudomonadota bacterium]
MSRWRFVAGVMAVVAVGLWHWLGARPYGRNASHAVPLVAPARLSARGTAAEVKSTQAAPSALASARSAPVTDAVFPMIPAAPMTTPPFEYTDNYLLVGLDRRPFGGGAGLSDTLLVAVFDEPRGALGLISIPRDLWVQIPGHGEDRINTVMNVARRAGEDPLELLGRVIENTLGLPIAHAVAIDIGVLERAVDALGGVTVNVPCPIIDRFLDPRDPTGYRKLDLAAGPVRMDGATAAMYARSRHGRSDFSRARRQQAILVGMRRELAHSGSVLRLPALFSEFEDSLETDLRRVDMLALAQRLLRVDSRRLHGLVLGAEQVSPFFTPDGKAVLRPNAMAIANALDKLFAAPAPGTPEAAATCPKADIALGSG